MFVYKQLTNNPESKQYVLIQKQKIIPVAYINNKVWPQFRNTNTLPTHWTCCLIGFKRINER